MGSHLDRIVLGVGFAVAYLLALALDRHERLDEAVELGETLALGNDSVGAWNP